MCNEEAEDADEKHWNGKVMKARNTLHPDDGDGAGGGHHSDLSKKEDKGADAVDGSNAKDVARYNAKRLHGSCTEILSIDCDDSVGVLVEELENLLQTPKTTDATAQTTFSTGVLAAFALALYIHEDISWYLDESDDKRTKGDRSNVVENQVADRLPNRTIKRVLVYGEVPEGNGPRDDKLLAGQDEFRSPDESDEVDPPEVFCQTLWNILNCHKSFSVVGHWGAHCCDVGEDRDPVDKERKEDEEGPERLDEKQWHGNQTLPGLMEESDDQRYPIAHHKQDQQKNHR